MTQGLTLDGRTAIVTGAGNGLGRAEAIGLAASGANVVLNDLPGPAVQAVADQISADGGRAIVCAGDVSDFSAGEAMLAAAIDAFGQLDIVVNNAGVLRDRMVFTMSEHEWDTVLRVHLRGHFVTTRLATAYWRERSKQARAVRRILRRITSICWADSFIGVVASKVIAMPSTRIAKPLRSIPPMRRRMLDWPSRRRCPQIKQATPPGSNARDTMSIRR